VQAEATADPLVGATLAERYHVVRLIGKGGMGVVYEAIQIALGKRVAIKLLLDKYADDREAVERFHREALTATQIGDDHIIDVLDIGTATDGRSFVVLEYLDGHDLGKLLAASGPMPASRAVHIVSQVLRGLGAAHAKGIVHRDMKPDNVFAVPHPETPDFIKILDFGISKVMAAQDAKVRLTATGTIVGTPVYMAPEQALGSTVDHRADLYSVGVMLYELLAGRPPFIAESYLALVTQHLQAVPPDLSVLRPDLPRSLVNAIHRALAKEPDDRFRTADEFVRALPSPASLRHAEGLGATFGSGVVPGTPNMRPVAAVMGASTARSLGPPEKARRRWLIGAGVLVAALGATIAGIVVAGGRGGDAGEARPARLAVETTPAGVRVFVDDDEVGLSPIVVTDLAPGRHRIRLELAGHVSLSTTKELTAGENASMMVAMQADDSGLPPRPAPGATRLDPIVVAPGSDPPATEPEKPGTRSDRPPRPGRPGGSRPGSAKSDPPRTDPPRTDPPRTDPPKEGVRQKPNPYADP
jgi:serine/threonine-protein kinase